ncbi:MAG TPA: M28 family peptidase [Vicinamibacterales bacterium]|jgi:hypothetical protein
MIRRPFGAPAAGLVLAVLLTALFPTIRAQAPLADRCVVPASIRDAVVDEFSGERAMVHVQMLAANRGRLPEEFSGAFVETTYIEKEATRAGLSDVKVDYFPASDAWQADEAELWMVQPVARKLASLTQVPAALAAGSASADVEAEMVYVGAGRDEDFARRPVTGTIVLGSGSVGSLFPQAVTAGGALGVLGTGSAGVSANSAGYTLDQIGWQSVSPKDKGGFGFVLSLRQFAELQALAEKGTKVVLRARVRTRRLPYRMNVVSARIPGSDPAAGELLLVAHAFENLGTPGANDNCTGVATVLEAGRTLSRLIATGRLAPPRRSIRFLWVPEIAGSRAFLEQNPTLSRTLLAVLNFDMTGADLKKTDTYLRLKMTPDSRPSYLNSLIGNLLQFVDQTEIRTQTGNNGIFNYRMVPYIPASDHAVFLDAGIAAIQFNHWPDNFYHSSGDTVANVDPTEMKRVGVTAGSAFYYLANAGPLEAQQLAWEAEAAAEKWVAEVARQSVRLLGDDASRLAERDSAMRNKVHGAFARGRGDIESVLSLARTPEVAATVTSLVSTLEVARDAQLRKLNVVYRETAARLGVKPVPSTLTDEERQWALVVPRRVPKPAAADSERSPDPMGPRRGGERTRPRGLPGLSASEVASFVDGTRSVLDIYNLVRAEYGNVTTSNPDFKFAWVITPESPDVELGAVAGVLQGLEKTGTIEMVKRASK